MGLIYIKFKGGKGTKNSDDKPNTWLTELFKKSVVKVLGTIIPKANPDFENKIDDVDHWLIEINDETETAEREIGVNDKGQTIVIMPFNRNSGYWTDLNWRLNDFIETFQATGIDGKEFNYRWDRFENGHAD